MKINIWYSFQNALKAASSKDIFRVYSEFILEIGWKALDVVCDTIITL